MPVSDLVQRMSNDELASWAAYEQVEGPVGTGRLEALLSKVSEQIHEGTWWYTQKNFQGKDEEAGVIHMNPLGEMPWSKGRIPRPGEDYKFGHEHVASKRISLLNASYANYPDDYPDDTEDGEAE